MDDSILKAIQLLIDNANNGVAANRYNSMVQQYSMADHDLFKDTRTERMANVHGDMGRALEAAQYQNNPDDIINQRTGRERDLMSDLLRVLLGGY